MNPFEMVVAIVFITGIVSIVRAKYGVPDRLSRRMRRQGFMDMTPDPEVERQREEIKTLKERIAVLERLATDNNSAIALDREIEKLR
jgi:hypothetical protein